MKIFDFKSYTVNSVVKIYILSFYIEGERELNEPVNKNKLITDLINTINEDINQIDYIRVSETVKNYNFILNDID